MAWIVLFVAGLMEIGWAIGLKYTDGFTRLVPSVLTLGCMVASVLLLGLALKTLPVGTGYAVWTGIGTVGTALLGIALFGEPATAVRLACIGLIVVQATADTSLPIVMTPGLTLSLFALTVVMCVVSAIAAIAKVTRIDPAMVFTR